MMKADNQPISDQGFADRVDEIIRTTITADYMARLFRSLQYPGPSGTESETAAPAIRSALAELNVPLETFTSDFLGLGFPALFAGKRGSDILFAAHADEISYIVLRSVSSLDLEPENLVPNFAHRPAISGDAVASQQYPINVVRWCGASGGYQVVGSGSVHWTSEDIRARCALTSCDGLPKAGDRLVYAPPVELDPATGLMTGKVDNRAGVTVAVAMCDALSQIARCVEVDPRSFQVGVLFPGQEEGTIGRRGEIELSFSRDTRAAGLAMAVADILPKAWINIDGHDIDPPPPSGLYTSVVSEARGAVVPPHVLSPYKDFFRMLEHDRGIDMRETSEIGGSVSRSDENGLLGTIPKRIVPLGYSERNPHYNAGLPTTNIGSLVQLASTITWLAVAFDGIPRSGVHLNVAKGN